jgi:hypothetical protein
MYTLAAPAGAGLTFPTVSVASTASKNELFAANELRNYLGNMSTSPVTLLVGDATPLTAAGADVIAVGYDATVALGVSADVLTGLKNDSYVISSTKTGIPKGSYTITGGKASQRGTGFAVYDFLRELGKSSAPLHLRLTPPLPCQSVTAQNYW